MVTALFDSNILIDHFNGVAGATDELLAYDQVFISSINWMEVACGMTERQIVTFNELLTEAGIVVTQTSVAIMVKAAEIRRVSKKKLPDCIVRATAEVQSHIIVTRDPSDFGGEGGNIRVPYDLLYGIAINIRPVPA